MAARAGRPGGRLVQDRVELPRQAGPSRRLGNQRGVEHPGYGTRSSASLFVERVMLMGLGGVDCQG